MIRTEPLGLIEFKLNCEIFMKRIRSSLNSRSQFRKKNVAMLLALMFIANPSVSRELISVNGNESEGFVSLSEGAYDQVYGLIKNDGAVSNGAVNLSGGVSIACDLDDENIGNSVIGVFGNAIVGSEVNAEALGGSVSVYGGNVFLNNDKVTELPDFVGVAGNLISADGGQIRAKDGKVFLHGGSIEQVELSSTSWQASSAASGNYVRVDHGTGEATNGEVEISVDVNGDVFGNQMYSPGDADLVASKGKVLVNNRVSTKGLHANYAYSQNGASATNDGYISVKESTVHGAVLGNFSFSWTDSATSSGANIYISGSVVDGNDAYGTIASAAESQYAKAYASGGTVIVENSLIDEILPTNSYLGVTGSFANVISGDGSSSYSEAIDGIVELHDVFVGKKEGSTKLYVVGSYAKVNSGVGSVKASGGRATMNGGALNGSLRGAIARTTNGTAESSDNHAVLQEGTITNATVYGSYVYVSNGSGEAISKDNSVSLINGTVVGGVSDVIVAGTYTKAEDGKASASGNKVLIQGGTTDIPYVMGAYVRSMTEAEATGNVVELVGTSDKTVITSDVYGGYAESSSDDASLITNNNSVFISGYNLDLSGASLYGGSSHGIENNVLNVSAFQGHAISIGNFEKLNFDADLGEITWGQGEAYSLLSLSEGIENTDSSAKTEVNLNVFNGESLEKGKAYTVVSGSRAESLVGENLNVHTNGLVDVEAYWDNETKDQLNIRIASKSGGDDSGLVHVPDVAASMLIADSSFMLDQLMPKKGLFAIAQASSSSTSLNADTDIDGLNFMTGVAGDFVMNLGTLRVATFLEYGDGDYDSARNMSDANGDIYYYDAGIQGKLLYEGGLVNEISFRFGRVHSDGYLRLDGGDSLKLKKESGFITAHAGLGWRKVISDALQVNPYLRYHYLRIDGDSDNVDGFTLRWDDYIVQKSILGINLKSVEQGYWNWSVGAAWEHIFDAEASARYGEVQLDDWNMEGDVGVVHAGVAYGHFRKFNPLTSKG